MKRAQRLLSPDDEEILEAISQSSLVWCHNDLTSESSVFEKLSQSLSLVDQRRIQELADNMPAHAFLQGIPLYEAGGDPVIIAQALYFGIDLLGSNNLNTITHDVIND